MHFRFRTDAKWFDVGHKGLHSISGTPEATLSDVVFIDCENTVSGLMEVGGAQSHVSTIIERKLSASGDVDGPVHIVKHQVTKLASGHRVFYSAIPRSALGSMDAWVGRQNGNVLLFDITSVLWSHIKESEGVLSQIGRRVVFLAKSAGQAIYVSTVAFSDSKEDLARACEALWDRVKGLVAKNDSPLSNAALKVRWAPILARRPLEWGRDEEILLAKLPFDKFNCKWEVPELTLSRDGDMTLVSVLPFLSKPVSLSCSLSNIKSRIVWFAAAYLREWTYMVLCLSVAGTAYSLVFGAKAEKIEREVYRIREMTAAADKERNTLVPLSQLPTGFRDLAKLIGDQSGVAARVDLGHVMNVVGIAARRSGVHIMRIYTIETKRNRGKVDVGTVRIGVDGLLGAGAGAVETSNLSEFVRYLRESGYEVTSEKPSGASMSNEQSARTFTYVLQASKVAKEEHS